MLLYRMVCNTLIAVCLMTLSAEVLCSYIGTIHLFRVLIDKMSELCAISTCLSQWNLSTRSPDALVVTNILPGVFCIMG